MKCKEAAFLWDESFLWGLMAYKALRGLRLPFDLIRAEDINKGSLKNYSMLFVPGGWASNKGRALGEDGIKAIQDFIAGGGNYLGFCGGAGLATQAKGGLGLVNVRRRPTKDRVPSFSGPVTLNVNEHPMWKGLIQGARGKGQGADERNSSLVTPDAEPVFHAWWPSQFIVEEQDINVLATYGEALPESFSSDLNMGDVEINGNWEELENLYQINLNPERLKHEPAAVEGAYGKGRVILSLLHFDTPGDVNGQRVLVNLWNYLAGQNTDHRPQTTDHRLRNTDYGIENEDIKELNRVENSLLSDLWVLCSDLISLGQRNFLWFWRNSMLLQWRRGVRGLEYNTLYIMMKEIIQSTDHRAQTTEHRLQTIKKLLVPFVEKAQKLLILERRELQQGNYITYEKCDVPEIKRLRTELFSEAKSHGGEFKDLINEIDECLFELLK